MKKISRPPTNLYPREARIEALKTLALNNYNYSQTEKQLKITRKTLKKWQDELGGDLELKQGQVDAMKAINDTIVSTKIGLVEKIEQVNLKALDKALDLIEKTKDLDKIGRLLVALKDYNVEGGNKMDSQKNKRMTIAERIERITNINNE